MKRQKLESSDVQVALRGAEIADLLIQESNKGNKETVFDVVNACIQELHMSIKPNPNYYTSLIYVAKIKPLLFAEDPNLVQLLSDCLKPNSFPEKRHIIIPIMAANLLYKAFKDEDAWPVEFIQAYLEDSLGDRDWVDQESTILFCSNILTVFPAERISASNEHNDDLTRVINNSPNPEIRNRYQMPEIRSIVEQNVNNIFFTFFQSSNGDKTKNIIKLMIVSTSLPDVRMHAASRLESWFNTPNLARESKILFLRLVSNTFSSEDHDILVVKQLLHIKFRGRAPGFFVEGISTLLKQNTTYLKIGLHEIPATFDPSDITSFHLSLFKACYDGIGHNIGLFELARVFKDMACEQRFSASLKQRVRVIIKSIEKTQPINYQTLCSCLLTDFPLVYEKDQSFQSFWVSQMVELICTLMVNAIPIEIFDGSSTIDQSILVQTFQLLIDIQKDSMLWVQHIMPKLSINQNAIQKVRSLLLLDVPPSAHLEKQSQDIVSAAINFFSVLPTSEDIIMPLLKVQSNKPMMTSSDIWDIIESLILRSMKFAQTYQKLYPPVDVTDTKFCSLIFNLSEFNMPSNGDEKLQVFANQLYYKKQLWRAHIVLVLCASLNSSTLGKFIWENIPSLRFLIQVIITQSWNNFDVFDEELENSESRQNIQLILSFERMITKTEDVDYSNSEFCPILTVFNPQGPPIRPSTELISSLKQLSDEFDLPQMFSRSREPDFILSIMRRQGPTESLKWLSPLIDNDPNTLHMLPAHFVSQLLLTCQSTDFKDKVVAPLGEYNRIIGILKEAFESSPEKSIEILEFFTGKLGSEDIKMRSLAKRSLHTLFVNDFERDSYSPEQFSWLMKIKSLKYFSIAKAVVTDTLLASIHKENDMATIKAYLNFVYDIYANGSKTMSSESAYQFSAEISNLILSKPIISRNLFSDSKIYSISLHAYTTFLKNPRNHQEDFIKIRWTGESEVVTLPVIILKGFIKLLCIDVKKGNPNFEEAIGSDLDTILSLFFTIDKETGNVNNTCSIYLDGEWKPFSKFIEIDDAMKMVEIDYSHISTFGLQSLEPNAKIDLLNGFCINHQCYDSIVKDLVLQELYLIEALKSNRLDQDHIRLQLDYYKEKYGFCNINFERILKDFFSDKSYKKSHSDVDKDLRSASFQKIEPSSQKQDIASVLPHDIPALVTSIHEDILFMSFNKIDTTILNMSQQPQQYYSDVLEKHKDDILSLMMLLHTRMMSQPPIEIQEAFSLILNNVSNHMDKTMHSILLSFKSIQNEGEKSMDLEYQNQDLSHDQFLSKANQILDSKQVNAPEELYSLSSIYKDTNQPLEAALIGLLPKFQSARESEKQVSTHTQGLILDIILEIASLNDFRNLKTYIFIKDTQDVSCKQLLINSIIHNTTWKTKRDFMDFILSESITKDNFDASSILSFLEAYLLHPDSWKSLMSRDVEVSLTLYSFSKRDMLKIIDICLAEISVLLNEKRDERVKEIIKLLFSIASQSDTYLQEAVKAISIFSTNSTNLEDLSDAGLLRVNTYVNYPWEFFFQEGKSQDFDLTLKPTRLDILMHKVIKTLYSEDSSKLAYAIIRKMAAAHPSIVLKFFPTLTSLLRGVVLSSDSNDDLSLLNYILGTIDVMKSEFLKQETSRVYVYKIMIHYIRILMVFKKKPYSKEYASLINKIFDLLCYMYIEFKSEENQEYKNLFDTENLKLFKDLKVLYPETKVLALLKLVDGNLEPEISISEEHLIQTKRQLSEASDLATILNSNSSNSINTLFEMVKELDLITSKVTSILKPILQNILDLTTWSSFTLQTLMSSSGTNQIVHKVSQIRKVSYRIILRYLHCYPNEVSQVMEKYIYCLQSDYNDVQSEALSHAADFFQYCMSPDHQINIVIGLIKLKREGDSELKKIIQSVLNLNFPLP